MEDERERERLMQGKGKRERNHGGKRWKRGREGPIANSVLRAMHLTGNRRAQMRHYRMHKARQTVTHIYARFLGERKRRKERQSGRIHQRIVEAIIARM